MHPDQHFTPGTRVKVLRTRYGWEQIHVGRTGTVIRQLGQSYAYGSVFPTYTYLVEMDAPRREQVTATALETVVNEVRESDRVRVVKTGMYGLGDVIDGSFGVVRQVRPNASGYAVQLDEPVPAGAPRVATVEKVEKVTEIPLYASATATVGDRVIVTRQPRAEGREHEGQTGKVVKIDAPYKVGGEVHHRYYHVDLGGGTVVKATKVTVLPQEKPQAFASGGFLRARDHIHVDLGRPLVEPLADWERDLIEGVDPTEKAEQEAAEAAAAPAEVPILVSVKRAQALKVSQEILGEFPDVDELIKLAAFVESGTATVEETETSTDDPDREVSFTDSDGDRITLDVATSEDGASTILTTNRDVAGVYIKDADVERIVSYLRARKGR